MEGDRVAFPEQGVQVHPAAALRGRPLGAAVQQDVHPQGQAQPGHLPACVAESHNAQGLSRQLHRQQGAVALLHRLAPLAGPGQVAGALDLVAQAQQQRQGVLGHGGLAVVGHVAHGDAQLPGGAGVNGVVPGGQGACVTQLGQPGKLLPSQNNSVEDYRLGALEAFHHQRGRGFLVDGQAAQPFQGFPGKVPRVGGASVQNNNVHSVALLSVTIIMPPPGICKGPLGTEGRSCPGESRGVDSGGGLWHNAG